ncbi:MAG TPA: glycosyltransferase, partial [Methanobacterium sp.]|nr:glycosyltransferase [Methanobacterium sp.]
MSYKISVVIPVYSVEDYIGECLDSVVNQTIGIENIELIVVNDCTPDNSMEIVKEYAQKYPSIKIIEHDTNQGQGPARNNGLKHATADYITFVDSDDFILENTYEVCLQKFENYGCDLVIYEYDYYSESGKKYPRNPSEIIFEENKLIEDIKEIPEIVFSTSPCNKVYSKELKSTLNFHSTLYEDMVPVITAIFSSKKIYVTNQCKYYYRKRESDNNSTTDNFLDKTDSYMDRITIHYQLYALLEKYPQYKPLIDWINAKDTRLFLCSMVLRNVFSHKERKEIFYKAKEYMADVSKETRDKFSPNWAEFLTDIQKKSYWPFFLKYKSRYPKIKRKLFSLSKKIFKTFKISFFILISYFYILDPKNRNIWIISERPTEAKDNGYRFFQYMRENHPQINSYYLIDKNSKEDYNRVKNFGNIIQYGSFKHKIYFILAKNLISSHKDIIEPWYYRNFRKYFNRFILEKKYIFLQHGVIKDDISDILGKKNPNN